ncbi:helix-turn-helix transcriptional regulator [Priestia megaterium]|uniref:helix-turn-helix domain-containing protein n=1 Tax=Priestia megaterium TaxID=1404 RepID=UPI00249A09E1|nr:helix-turn-helix transcriptional regulator [Priestia megaterium]MDI3089699.1 helix-turn-helix transcriptional regulator [Priestia megaterium]
MRIAEQIKKIRKNENLSQEQLGQKMNVTRQAIYKWESGKGYPDIQNLIMLSELFEISLDELIKGDRSLQGKIKVKGGTGMFSNRSLLSALNYFSLFFAPIVFPLITLIFGYKDMKQHGKRAFISHLIPTATLIVIGISYYISAKLAGTQTPNSILVSGGTILIILIMFGVIIWNVKEGVKQLKA